MLLLVTLQSYSYSSYHCFDDEALAYITPIKSYHFFAMMSLVGFAETLITDGFDVAVRAIDCFDCQ